MHPSLKADLASLLNKYSAENDSDTPDFILAEYLIACLDAWGRGIRQREQWYGRPIPGQDGG